MIYDKCLVPISVGSDLFRTNIFLQALRPLLSRHSCFIFLVADEIQIYNKISRINSAAEFVKTLNSFRSKNQYIEERQVWIDRVFSGLKQEDYKVPEWSVFGIDNFIDKEFYHVYKSVLLMYESVSAFKYDIIEAARLHVEKYNNIQDHERQVNLAIYYLLEEIAVNIRLRVCEKIFYEYYIGENLLPLIKLYHGLYDLKVEELIGYFPSSKPFLFYHYINSPDSQQWKLID
jgi:hypothetical protein